MTTPLQKAAQALMDAAVQTDFTCRLGEQLDACEKALDAEIAQSVEPFAYVTKDGIVLTPCDTTPDDVPLYLHPPQPQATTPVPATNWLIRKEPNTKDKYYVAEGNQPEHVLEIYGITQGEKP